MSDSSDSYIIAVDFGTAYSGYAFNLTQTEAEIKPHVKRWVLDSFEGPKTPTCILFNENEEFVTFGYEAKMAYLEMGDDEAQKYLFFEFFKMSLYGTKLSRSLEIKAANGRSMNAFKVFTEALRYMKDDALKTISENTHGREFISSDFTWVLTVPAIWDHSAKQFMREAATEAGIVTKGKEDKLVIALEPEAASVWCKTLPAQGFITENFGGETLDQAPGTQYIVVDCGGGTIDITVHEVLEGGNLKELHKASGNDMGGQCVDRKFILLLREIFTDFWDEYSKTYPSEVQRMMFDFRVFKKSDKDVKISCTMNFGSLATQRNQSIESFFKSVEGASWNNGSIQISKEKLRSFFDESLGAITKILKGILKKYSGIKYILLVGGFAESQILRQHIIEQFKHQCKVLCPVSPQEAVMKGAVKFGRNPEVVASRKSAFTYGFAVCQRFDESKHKAEKKFTNSEGVWCDNIFCTMVKNDEDVGWDESREHILYPIAVKQTAMRFSFFRTQKKNAIYVDESGVENIGSFVVDMPDTTRGINRQVKLKIRFGYTEMRATATDLDSKTVKSVKLEFMRSFHFTNFQKCCEVSPLR